MEQVGKDLNGLVGTFMMMDKQLAKTITDLQKLNADDVTDETRKPINEEKKRLIDLLKSYEKVNTFKEFEGVQDFNIRVNRIGELLEINSHKAGRLVHKVGLKTQRYNFGYLVWWKKGDLERIEKEMER
jgi:hypothetical protein